MKQKPIKNICQVAILLLLIMVLTSCAQYGSSSSNPSQKTQNTKASASADSKTVNNGMADMTQPSAISNDSTMTIEVPPPPEKPSNN